MAVTLMPLTTPDVISGVCQWLFAMLWSLRHHHPLANAPLWAQTSDSSRLSEADFGYDYGRAVSDRSLICVIVVDLKIKKGKFLFRYKLI